MMAKAAANYMNGGLIKMEAVLNGFAEGIALDTEGNVSEGSGENLFLIKDSKVYTPPLASAILPGITRRSAMTILQEELGLEVIRQRINREMLYLADELFFTGTAAEITPIATVDRHKIGSGARGPITEKVQSRYLSIVKGEAEDKYGWLTLVNR
jgi:branched-chain amino acid aminotransferase